MRRRDSVNLWLCAYTIFLGATAYAGDINVPASNPLPEMVTMQVGAVRITNRTIELRCEIANQTGHDIWLYAPEYDLSLGEGDPWPLGCTLFFRDEDGPTLFAYGCIDARWNERNVYGSCGGVYVRLPSGDKRAEVLSCPLPLQTWLNSSVINILTRASRNGTDLIRRLVFAIGYYTEEDLKPWAGAGCIHHEESGNIISIYTDTQALIVSVERRIETSIVGVRVPIMDLLPPEEKPKTPSPEQADMSRRLLEVFLTGKPIPNMSEHVYAEDLLSLDRSLFNDAAKRIAGVFTQLADGRLPLEDLQTRLDEILSGPERYKLLKELQEKQFAMDRKAALMIPVTPLEALEDLFYGFSVGLEEYRFGKQLLSLDRNLFDRSARRMANVYMDVIEGKSCPSEITSRLDKILSKDDRDSLIQRLSKQRPSGGK